jgi:hypothetical protein
MTIRCGIDFGRAVGEQYALKNLLDVKLNTNPNDVLSLTLTIAVSEDELEAIAKRMRGEDV